MRPAADVHLALLQAAHAIKAEYAASGKGATLAELAHRACVGYKVARVMVPSLKRRGKLAIVGERKVAGRNRPAAEYAPAKFSDLFEASGKAVLDQCIAGWHR